MSNTTNRQGSGSDYSMLRRPFSGTGGGGGDAKIAKFIEIGKDIIEENKNDLIGGKYDINVVSDNRLLYPVIILTDQRQIKGNPFVFYSVLILGNTCRRSSPVIDVKWNDMGPTVALPVTPDVFYNTPDVGVILGEAIINVITKMTGIATPESFHNCGEFVVQNIPGQDDSYQNRSFVANWLYILSNATYSTYLNIVRKSGLLKDPDDYYFNIKLLRGTPSTNISYGGTSLVGYSGEPIRRDLTITLSNVLSTSGASVFVNDVGKEIVKVSGYIDTSWNGNGPFTGKENRYLSQYKTQNTNSYEPVYSPVGIITDFVNCTEDNIPPTLEVMLAGIIAFTLVRDPSVWQRTYDPNYIGQNTAYNIGATVEETGLVIPKGEDIDFHDYINAAWSQKTIIAIDVVRNGSNYWALQPFVKNDTSAIIEASDNFLRGRFKSNWNYNDPIIGSKFVLQGGYYQQGKDIYDIREIDDYIYALNLLCGDSKTRQDGRLDFDTLIDSLNDNWCGYSLDQRLATRFNILNNMANNSFVPTSTIDRIVLTPQFINTLIKGSIEAGIMINTSNITIKDNYADRHGLRIGNYGYGPVNNIFVRNQNTRYR